MNNKLNQEDLKKTEQKINSLWNKLISNITKIIIMRKQIEFLLNKYGTIEPCNRFVVGNCIENIIGDLLKSLGFVVSMLPNAKRYDIIIDNEPYSIKFSSSGNITLHNSNSCINKDETMRNTILMTLDNIYLLTDINLKKNDININKYIFNAGDSLKLKRKLLTDLKTNNYPFIYNINIKYNKKECKNKLCSKVFYDHFLNEFNNLNLQE
jgi:hypothetical protein